MTFSKRGSASGMGEMPWSLMFDIKETRVS